MRIGSGASSRRRALIGFGGGQVAVPIPMLALERKMRRTGGPGIIPFELAGTPERSRRIVERWGADGQSAARASLLLDYPYLVSYAGLQAAICGAASDALREAGRGRLAAAGHLVATAQWGAGAFDAVENTALLGVLAGRSGRLPGVARTCAGAKFALLGLGWLYAALGFLSHRQNR